MELWNENEMRAAVNAYFEMFDLEKRGVKFSKIAIAREYVSNELRNRTVKAFGRRMSNISAILHDMNQPYLTGYKPAFHVGAGREILLKALIQERIKLVTEDFEPTSNIKILKQRVKKLRARTDLPRPPGNQYPRISTNKNKKSFQRCPQVVAWVLNEAKGVCEACKTPAPFNDRDGSPYLEVHHVKFLSKNGPDTVENSMALCPTCHRRAHHAFDRENFNDQLYNLVERLERY